MKYAQFDKDGKLVTRFDESADYLPHPSGTVEISEEIFWKTVNEQDGIWKRDPATGDIAKHPFPPAPPDQIKSAKIATVQQHMDLAASACGYDDIKTVVTYAEEPAVAKFQNEGRAFRAWRSLVWAQCYAILDEVNAGMRDIPTDDELISELPALVLPE